MKILLIGDIYSKTGRKAIETGLKDLKELHKPDWIIVNGENTTGGNGLSLRHARFLKELGIDVITSGNHIFARPDWPSLLTELPYVLRPHNIGDNEFAGTGFKIFEKPEIGKIAVLNLAGRVFMERAACPFKTADFFIKNLPAEIPLIIDFHAEATSEKQAFFWYIDGRATVAVGTHTHVQTADERILPNGTAVITDLGMTGAKNSVIGVKKETIIKRFIYGYSERFDCATGKAKIEGVLVDYSPLTLKSNAIKRIYHEIGI